MDIFVLSSGQPPANALKTEIREGSGKTVCIMHCVQSYLQRSVAEMHDDGRSRAEPRAQERQAHHLIGLARRHVRTRLKRRVVREEFEVKADNSSMQTTMYGMT